ncbi:MAG TPA: transporter substrate-binding domain-containing protein [Xanthobacteraceae bacterium]|jgi:polar amino acid transport system substrate-binding protein
MGMISTTHSEVADGRGAEFMSAGTIRLGLFVPQYTRDAKTAELLGRGIGIVGIEITRGIATRLGIRAQIIGYETPANVIESLNASACDIAVMGIEPSRVEQVDFSPPVVEFDYTYLARAGSPIQRMMDADQFGVRIAFVSNHASSLALARIIKCATLIGADLPDAAFDLLRTGQADLFAFPRHELIDYGSRLRGSRNLEEPYGVNLVGLAVPKGSAGRLAFVSEIVEEAKSSGLIQQIIIKGQLAGFRVARIDESN